MFESRCAKPVVVRFNKGLVREKGTWTGSWGLGERH